MCSHYFGLKEKVRCPADQLQASAPPPINGVLFQ
jgi:hypothetical protein